jgi:hypothetical protein
VKEMAATHDDAKAEPYDWDVWIVNNYSNTSKFSPLICNGKYDKSKHEKLFCSFCKLLEHRYRQNVLQSFLKFMKKEHFP